MQGATGKFADLGQDLDLAPKDQTLQTSPYYVDQKLDFLVKELKRLSVAVADIQGRWFGEGV